MNLSELRTRVYSELSEDENAYFVDEDINHWLNLGQEKIARDVRHLKDSATLNVTDEGSYKLPADFIEEYQVWFNNKKITSIPMEEKESDTKEGYYKWEDDIYLVNLSDGDLDLYYFRKPDEMLEDIDTPEVPLEFQDLLIEYAVYRAKRKDRQYNEGQAHYQDFLRGIEVMKGRYGDKPSKKQWRVKRI